MRPIERAEIVDWQTYEDGREATRPAALAAKDLRRVQLGEHFTFLFENRDTIRYQIQEMMRVEKIVREADIEHEIATYNELLFDDGRLGCSLLIGIDDPEERAHLLTEWLGLPEHLYAELPDGTRVRPEFDARQVGETRLSSVQYLAFRLGRTAPVALGVDHPKIRARVALTDVQRAALQSDLEG
ncbi:MAG: DUF3501 family protein [Sandaracinaceae bacterium]|nr:DUF3501 family protein [Sandaracinaceae bacterium]